MIGATTRATIDDWIIGSKSRVDVVMRAVDALAARPEPEPLADELAAAYVREMDVVDGYRFGEQGQRRIRAAEDAVIRRHIEIEGVKP